MVLPLLFRVPADIKTHDPTALPHPSPLIVHGALFLVGLLFGANYFVAKVAMREITPPALVAIRTLGAAAVLFAASAFWRGRAPRITLSKSDFAQLFAFSLLGASINQLCFLEGLTRSTATNASIIFVATPVVTLAFAVLLRRERASWQAITGIILGLIGALILIVPRGGVDITTNAMTGNILLFLGAASYSLYLVLTRPILTRHDPLRVVSWTFLFAGLTMVPIGYSGLKAVYASGLSPAAWWSVAYAVVGATALPYLLNNWALVRVQASTVAIYILVQPLVAGGLGHIFLGERLGADTAVAAILIVGGVVVAASRRTA